MSQRSHHSPSPARSHVSNEPSRRSFAASPVREVTPITRQPTPAMEGADDTLYPLEISDAENLVTELEKVELRRIKGPLDHAKLVYSEIKKWKFQLILGLFERDAAKVGLGNSWKEKRDEALALAQEYLGREPIVLPELVRGPMSRNEARNLREVWDIVSNCLSSPLALLRVSKGRHKVAALAIRPDKYAEVINCCSALLAKNMAALLKFNYPIPVMPIFGKNGVSEDAFEVYKFSEFEILGLAFRKEVEAFILYLTRFQHRIEEHAAAEKAKKPRESPPHFDSPRGGPRTSTPKKHQELDNSDIESADDEGEDLAHRTTRFVTPTQHASQSRMDPLRFSMFDPEVPRRGKRLTELFGKGGIPPPPLRNGQGPGGDPSDDSDSDGDSDRGRPGRKIPPPPPGKQPKHPHKHNQAAAEPADSHKEVSRFDLKLKMDVVPTWDGNTDSLTRWLMKVNSLAKRSTVIFSQLGIVAPQRFRGNAENWFYSLPEDTRDRIQSDWSTLKEAIRGHYMNRHWLDRQKAKANKARYREGGYSKETPSEYYIRKLELLEFVYDYSDAELITEIMSGAPVIWNTILNPHQFVKVTDLQDTIKYYEETLAQLSDPKEREGRDSQFRPFRPRDKDARANLAKAPTSAPKFPKDDSTISKRKTPEEMGVRPCRHCGSGKHWDNECKYSTSKTAELAGKLADTGTSFEDCGGITTSFVARTEESRFRGLSSRLGRDAFVLGDLIILKAWPPSSVSEGEVEFSTAIRLPDSPNNTSVSPPSRKIESMY